MSLVTLSASYGAGGSEVGPRLAERLGVPFVDRVIHSEAGAGASAPLDAAPRRDDVNSSRLLARLLTSMAPIGGAYGIGEADAGATSERSLADAAACAIFERADSGRGVILGRAAAVVLRGDPRALHVRLDGPMEARLEQAMRLQDIGREEAEQRMNDTDPARRAYVRRFHQADARDPALYHLIIDSTAIDLSECVEIIALAARRRAEHP